MDDFKKAAVTIPTDTLMLDVRSQEEGSAGMIKGVKLIPDDEILDRLAEIPKDKKIITYCSSGVRAEMAYHKFKGKGYAKRFVNANIDIDKYGNSTIERPKRVSPAFTLAGAGLRVFFDVILSISSHMELLRV